MRASEQRKTGPNSTDSAFSSRSSTPKPGSDRRMSGSAKDGVVWKWRRGRFHHGLAFEKGRVKGKSGGHRYQCPFSSVIPDQSGYSIF